MTWLQRGDAFSTDLQRGDRIGHLSEKAVARAFPAFGQTSGAMICQSGQVVG